MFRLLIKDSISLHWFMLYYFYLLCTFFNVIEIGLNMIMNYLFTHLILMKNISLKRVWSFFLILSWDLLVKLSISENLRHFCKNRIIFFWIKETFWRIESVKILSLKSNFLSDILEILCKRIIFGIGVEFREGRLSLLNALINSLFQNFLIWKRKVFDEILFRDESNRIIKEQKPEIIDLI